MRFPLTVYKGQDDDVTCAGGGTGGGALSNEKDFENVKISTATFRKKHNT